jgi:release factor glutamine methyltransferase
MKTLRDYYKDAEKRLRGAGIDNPAFDAAALIEKHSGIKRYEIAICEKIPETFEPQAFYSDVTRREKHEPLQYILGIWSFYGLDFFVGKGVLIPRQDTEILAETAIEFLKNCEKKKFLELCAGSGCLSTAITKTVENSKGVCVELSPDALFYLKKNIAFHGLSEKLSVIEGDVLKNETAEKIGGEFSLIVCNPPYIKSCDINFLQPEVADFEPRMALDGGSDGLLFYRKMSLYLKNLVPGGMIALEVGIDEAGNAVSLLSSFGLERVFIKKDYGGVERVVGGFKSR